MTDETDRMAKATTQWRMHFEQELREAGLDPAKVGPIRVCAACGGPNGEHLYSNCVYAPENWTGE